MIRLAATFLVLTAAVHAHGGSYRPPPRRPLAGDAARPPILNRPTAARVRFTTPSRPWEYWWRLNRAPYLRLRARVAERTVVSGARARAAFDRAKVRDEVLLPLMLGAIKSSEKEIRTSAAVALGKFRAPAALPLLLGVLKNDSVKQVREAAMLGLVLLRDPLLRDEFRRVVEDDKRERRERAWAALGLGFIGDHDYLARVLRGKVPLTGAGSTADEIRACAALALGWAGHRGAAPLLSTLIDKDAEQQTRGFAGSGLARVKSPFAEADLLELIEDPLSNYMARYGAAIAAGRIVSAKNEGIVDRLGKKAGRDRDRALRAQLVMSLGRIGGDRAANHIVVAHRTAGTDKGFTYLALGMTKVEGADDVLAHMFDKENNPTTRGACALGLALCGYKKAARRLREQVKRGNPGFVPHGMVALGLLDDPKAIPLVREILTKSSDPVVCRAAALSLALLRRSGAVPELVELLARSKSTFLRGAIAAALGQIGTENAIKPLTAIYKDKKRTGEERAIALAALGRIGDVDDIPLFSRLAIDLNPYVQSDAIRELLRIL